jgi:hypothetical protein
MVLEEHATRDEQEKQGEDPKENPPGERETLQNAHGAADNW